MPRTCLASLQNLTIFIDWSLSFYFWHNFTHSFVWPSGLGVWFSLRVREVPGSNPGLALFCISQLIRVEIATIINNISWWRLGCDGRVVKALDSKSNGIFPRRFEPCSQRNFVSDINVSLVVSVAQVLHHCITEDVLMKNSDKGWLNIITFLLNNYPTSTKS